MVYLFDKENVLVTGGTGGIGRGIALAFAKAGANVAITGTSEERGKEVVQELELAGPGKKFNFYKANLGSREEIKNMLEAILKDLGSLEILINNAGITKDGLLMNMKEEDWDAVININLNATFYLCKNVIRAMLKARKGKIVNIASVIGIIGNAGQANYAASKAGVIGFTKALAKEVAKRNICVNCIAPGFVQTSMTDALTDKQKEEILKEIPIGRIGKVEEIAEAAVFLASSKADYITGQVLVVDGGMVM